MRDIASLERIALILNEQLSAARSKSEAEGNERVNREFATALKRFSDFVSKGIVPRDLRDEVDGKLKR